MVLTDQRELLFMECCIRLYCINRKNGENKYYKRRDGL